MTADSPPRRTLYYPFHLCHDRTLDRLLARFDSVHFRDFMALQLTPLAGITAYADRMGDRHAGLVQSGRLVQGYDVSGPLDPELAASVDRDLCDAAWRADFQKGLRSDRRFQRGLFDFSHSVRIAGRLFPGPAALLRLLEDRRQHEPWSLDRVKALSGQNVEAEQGFEYEYGLALVKTSAALNHTVRLAHRHGLTAVTDSPVHFALLERSRQRDGISLEHAYLEREGY